MVLVDMLRCGRAATHGLRKCAWTKCHTCTHALVGAGGYAGVWVRCDACLAWMHGVCVGCKRAPKAGTWVCQLCQRAMANQQVCRSERSPLTSVQCAAGCQDCLALNIEILLREAVKLR
eukprot:245078-Pelagomonas_calceolata.AAC.5